MPVSKKYIYIYFACIFLSFIKVVVQIMDFKNFCSVQLLSHVQLCDPMDCSMTGFPVHHQLPGLSQTHQVGEAIQPSHPLMFPSPPAFSLFQDQGLLHWVTSWHQAAKVLELQHQSFQWIFSPSSELIPFRMDWFDLLAVQGTLKSFLQHQSLKVSISMEVLLISHFCFLTLLTIP